MRRTTLPWAACLLLLLPILAVMADHGAAHWALRGQALLLPPQAARLVGGRLQPVGRPATVEILSPRTVSGWGSPDFRRLAYVSVSPGTEVLVITDLASATSRHAGRHTGYGWVGWSPDGKTLCALRGDEYGSTPFRVLSLVDAATGTETDIDDHVATAEFASDGRSLVYSRVLVGERAATYEELNRSGIPGMRRAFLVSSPPGTRGRPANAAAVDRLLGPAYRRALAVWQRTPSGIPYAMPTHGLWRSPDGRCVLVGGLEPGGYPLDPIYQTSVYWHYPPEFALVRDRSPVVRAKPSGSKVTLWPDSYRPAGWSVDGRTIYLLQSKGDREEAVLAAMDTHTGRVLRRQRLRRTDGAPVRLVAFRPD